MKDDSGSKLKGINFVQHTDIKKKTKSLSKAETDCT